MTQHEALNKICELLKYERKLKFKNRKDFVEQINKNKILDISLSTYFSIETSKKILNANEYYKLFILLKTESIKYKDLIFLLESFTSPFLFKEYSILNNENKKRQIPIYNINSISNNDLNLSLKEFVTPFINFSNYKEIIGLSIYHKLNYDYKELIANQVEFLLKDSAYLFIDKGSLPKKEKDMLFCIYDNQIIMREYNTSACKKYVTLRQIAPIQTKLLVFKREEFENQSEIKILGRIIMFQRFLDNLID